MFTKNHYHDTYFTDFLAVPSQSFNSLPGTLVKPSSSKWEIWGGFEKHAAENGDGLCVLWFFLPKILFSLLLSEVLADLLFLLITLL